MRLFNVLFNNGTINSIYNCNYTILIITGCNVAFHSPNAKSASYLFTRIYVWKIEEILKISIWTIIFINNSGGSKNCTYLHIFARICTILYISAHFCTFLHIPALSCTFCPLIRLLYKNVQNCAEMCRNVQKCTEMSENVQKCAKIYKDVQFNIIIRRKINELHKCIQTLLIIIINISHVH